MSEVGRLLLFVGGGIFLLGLLLLVVGRIPGLGQLPGDIHFQRGNASVYLPLGTMIVLSILLTVVLNIVARLLR
jgi:hypothetical protein